MPPKPFGDQQVQQFLITDFTPGVMRFSRGSYPDTYAVNAPTGSASVAYRCWAIPNVGLGPFFHYYPAQTYTPPTRAYPQTVTLSNMLPLPGANPDGTPFADSIIAAFFSFGSSAGQYEITRANTNYQATSPSTGTSIYVTTGGLTPVDPLVSMDYGIFSPSANPAGQDYRRTVITNDPYNTVWITVGSWNSTGPYISGTLPAPAAYTVRLFFHEYRVVYLHASTPANDTDGFGGAGQDFVSVSSGASPTMDLNSWTFSGVYYPELGGLFATWGSISSGELFLLYADGGAVIITGDLGGGQQQVIKLPAVTGPGDVFGPAAQTAAGLVYATETDGAYMWNGDNTAQKISANIPDDELIRTTPPGSSIIRLHSSQKPWGSQVMFPNNWMFDTITGGWWQVEDPSIVNFQVHAPSSYGPKSFLSAPGYVTVPASVPPVLTIYSWDRFNYQSNYVWISNPVPASQGALVNVSSAEIVASNPTVTDAIITITPTIPAKQTPFQNQNQAQTAPFRIPANTVGYRASHRLGYTDYNVQIRVDAANVTSNPAPVIHQINVGYSLIRPSSVS